MTAFTEYREALLAIAGVDAAAAARQAESQATLTSARESAEREVAAERRALATRREELRELDQRLRELPVQAPGPRRSSIPPTSNPAALLDQLATQAAAELRSLADDVQAVRREEERLRERAERERAGAEARARAAEEERARARSELTAATTALGYLVAGLAIVTAVASAIAPIGLVAVVVVAGIAVGWAAANPTSLRLTIGRRRTGVEIDPRDTSSVAGATTTAVGLGALAVFCGAATLGSMAADRGSAALLTGAASAVFTALLLRATRTTTPNRGAGR